MLRCTGPALIVEDDPNTANLLKTYLEHEGFTCEIATDGEKAVRLARHRRPCIIILDIMLPKLDGWEVCRQVRTFSNVPVLMLTAREEEIDRVTGLSLGADDYVIKPFSPRELVARVKAILRRSNMQTNSQGKMLRSGGLEMDLDRHRVNLDGRIVDLTSLEYKLLQALMQAPGRVFSRSELLDAVYHGGEIVIDRVVDVHIGKLRQKIERQPSQPRYIRTVRGFGYAFADPEDL
ncbi:response regulator transcription factor [Desulfoprunum benzoelyticum]|uniref:Phosphate regulon transcriptional regulatory protein PhoB n=2 Tax=Desulfoprunum benzoelyticum TaxID=1506996 RepID=A0A840V6R9_9BACT|nr:response regulator transcription factor [Desulfoprunum benzoelyticum]MBB5349449.1 DNA-binding response OmpR family regulator [Desulfoprunum benzoelyticum]MBM9531462.1 response regulator transcription factor [Desulfoprunum benzoelyticum]